MARKILVVEDDHNISDLIRMYLEKEGFEVYAAFDGAAAVEKFREISPDMVLLDIMLPVMDGWSVCAKNSRKQPHSHHHDHRQERSVRPHSGIGDGRGRLHR